MMSLYEKVGGSYINETVAHSYVKDIGIQTDIMGKSPGDGADYSGLNEGEFYALGSGGGVGSVGPQQPNGTPTGPDAGASPVPPADDPQPAPEPPVEV